jgi:hypothetical protein
MSSTIRTLKLGVTKWKFWAPLLAGILLTAFPYSLGALLSGGGHSFTAMVFFFTYGVTLG